jgi:hypothetical protein
VAVGNSRTIITSQDGTVWAKQTSGVTSDLIQVIYANNNFAVWGGTNSVVLTSSDGVIWAQRTSGLTSNLRHLIYANKRLICWVWW